MVFAGSTRLRSLWTPERINTSLWLDAADSSTITTISGGVSEWRDKKGNGINLIPTTVNRPSYGTVKLSDLNTITFAGNTMLRANNFPTSFPTSLVVFGIFKWITTGTTTLSIQCLVDNKHGGNPPQGFVLQDRPDLPNDPLTAGAIPNDTGGARDTITTGNGTWRIVGGVFYRGVSDNIYRDGILAGTKSNTGLYNITAQINIGGWGLASDSYRYLVGDCAEVIISSDASAIDKINGYLAHKWGLVSNLSVSHPYKNFPPRGA